MKGMNLTKRDKEIISAMHDVPTDWMKTGRIERECRHTSSEIGMAMTDLEELGLVERWREECSYATWGLTNKGKIVAKWIAANE